MTYICVINNKFNLMENNIKEIVKAKYSVIANQSKTQNETSCCGGTDCSDSIDYTIFSDDYSAEKGYEKDADLGLGCGLPTQYANIKKGDSVLDLGSGAGNDCFVARAEVGPSGKVTGIDFTEEMIDKAVKNNLKLGYQNIEFVLGDIENMPFEDNTYDVAISNCVLNLVPDKKAAFREIFRVLKSEGHMCISDVVIKGNLPDKLINDVALYAGCISGALPVDEYLEVIKNAGFKNITIDKEKEIKVPNSIMLNHMELDELRKFKSDKIGIFSITLSASK